MGRVAGPESKVQLGLGTSVPYRWQFVFVC